MKKRLVAFALLCGCASAPSAQQPVRASRQQPHDQQPRKAVAVTSGYGTLRQDEFTVALRSDELLVKVTPLAESVIRLAAPDTYNRLNALAETRREAAVSLTRSNKPELFLVSFFSYEPDVTFQPEDLQLVYQGRQLRAAAILPLSALWGQQRLQQQETATAIYAFDTELDYELPIVVRYGIEENDAWSRIISKLQVERAKVAARAGNR
jgi:hypothetical protein